MTMLKKTVFLCLCIAVALSLGCSRSKPPSSKVDTQVKMEEGSNAPSDTLPPKTAAPATPPPHQVAPAQQQGGVQFGPLPPNSGKDPWGDAEREQIMNARRMQAAGIKPTQKQPETQSSQPPDKAGQ